VITLLTRLVIVLALALAGGAFVGAQRPALKDLPLIREADLVYQGSFRIENKRMNGTRMGFGASGLGFNPARNSLYAVGHDQHQLATEISIPEPRKTDGYEQLPVAEYLQNFFDPLDGKRAAISPSGKASDVRIGTLLPFAGKLIVSAWTYYDAGLNTRTSHVVSSLDLSVPDDAQGPFVTDAPRVAYTAVYMSELPDQWKAAFGAPVLAGGCCTPIISRTSYGPAAFAIDPSKFVDGRPLPARPLVFYPNDKMISVFSQQGELANAATNVNGAMVPTGTRTVLFIGRQGLGPVCYGSGAKCNDPHNADSGFHAPPYRVQVWAYDALELLAVAEGLKKPWEPRPYAVWGLTLPFERPLRRLQSAAFDPATNRIFIAPSSGEEPLVHVMKVTPPR
jgi:hypothetical protein